MATSSTTSTSLLLPRMAAVLLTPGPMEKKLKDLCTMLGLDQPSMLPGQAEQSEKAVADLTSAAMDPGAIVFCTAGVFSGKKVRLVIVTGENPDDVVKIGPCF